MACLLQAVKEEEVLVISMKTSNNSRKPSIVRAFYRLSPEVEDHFSSKHQMKIKETK